MREIAIPAYRWLAVTIIGAALALSACTSQSARRQAELTALAVQLPGGYDNSRQTLTVLRVPAPLVGDRVFYVRETAANDLHRVISERIWSLEVAADARIIGAVYAFDEPDRWHSAVDSPEIFRSLLLRDLRPVSGCELIWQKTVRGFSAVGASPRCPQNWRLEGDELAFSDHPAAGDGADSYYHFLRRGGELPGGQP